MSTPLAAASEITHRFGPVSAVERVSLTVEPGEVVGLLGANGAGKTTLVRILLGVLAPTEGEVALFGRPPSKSSQRRLGYVPQGLGLYDDLTPSENLAFTRAVFAGGRRPPTTFESFPAVPVGQLSLGLQRRVAFAAAVDHGPELLVLDEPTSGVGPLAGARLWEMVRDVTDGGAGALVTTHNMEEAEQCDRLVVMAAGLVVASGTVDAIVGDRTAVSVASAHWAATLDVLEAAGLPASLVGSRLRVPGASLSDVRRALGDLPAHLDVVPATLEEAFVELAVAQHVTSAP